MIKRLINRVIDNALEVSVVGSFSKIGYNARRCVEDWSDATVDLGGQVVVLTGGTTGIGNATAAGLIARGAEVHLTSRSLERAQDAAAALVAGNESHAGTATGHALETSDYDSVRAFATRLNALESGIDIVIHNAGALGAEYQVNAGGTELTLAAHLIGPYLLTTLLKPSLNPGARVLFMSSGGMYSQKLDVDHIEMKPHNYKGAIAYARAKRGQVELVSYLAAQWAPDVQMHAMHPGWVATPGVDAGLPGFGKVMGPILRDADAGADTMIWLAEGGASETASGQFWHDRQPRGTAYVPGTRTSDDERRKLVAWLDAHIAAT